MIHRQTVLAGAAVALSGRARAETVALRVGDQKGGAQALMQAAGALADLPYQLDWS